MKGKGRVLRNPKSVALQAAFCGLRWSSGLIEVCPVVSALSVWEVKVESLDWEGN